MRSKWADDERVRAILVALTPINRLACEVSRAHGLRIGDVLALKTSDIRKGRFTIHEEKTGKPRRISLTKTEQSALLGVAGRVYVFEHRTDWKRHRTRNAVYKDVVRAARAFRLEGFTPHSLRKAYAVEKLAEYGGDTDKVRKLLNHSNEAVTMIYTLADMISPVTFMRRRKAN